MSTQIPDGYELLVGRNTQNAILAIDTAEERGFPAESVLTQRDGYLVPLDPDEIVTVDAEEVDLPGKNASKAEIEEFATKWGIDISSASNNPERLAAIDAEIAKRTEDAENGILTPAPAEEN